MTASAAPFPVQTSAPTSAPAGGPPASAILPGAPDTLLSEHALDGGTVDCTGETWEFVWGGRSVRNVSRATLTAFLPEPGLATGTAVVVAPGGAFMALMLETEGYRVARRLADAGIAAFVLKYRLDPTPPEPEGFVAAITQRIEGGRLSDPQAPWPDYPCEAAASADGLAALRWVRQRAADFKLRASRIGFLGFSAGGMLAMRVGTQYPDTASRPDFLASVYGAMDRRSVVPADAPPIFLAAAADDRLLAHMALPMMAAWQAAGRPAELHVYERGGHGFGGRAQGSSSDAWLNNFLHWLRARGQLSGADCAMP